MSENEGNEHMKRRRLLVVDDDDMVRQLVSATAGDIGFEVLEANDGMEAINIIKSGNIFDVVIADVRMPGMGGLELLKFLGCFSPHPVIILVTGYGTVEIAREAMLCGAFEYLTKPFDIRLVEKTLEAAVYHKKLLDEYHEEEIKIPRVLLIEDDKDCRNMIECIIREMGYDVAVASNGLEGLQLFNQSFFEIVVSDINMPEIDGIALQKKLKEIDPNVVLILVTAYPDIDIAVRTIKGGAYDFVCKPFDPDTLKTSIRNAWEKQKFQYKMKSLTRKLQKINKDLIFTEKKLEDQTIKLKELSNFTSHMVSKFEFIDEVVSSIPDMITNLFSQCVVRLWIKDNEDADVLRRVVQKGSEIKGSVNNSDAGAGAIGIVYQSGAPLCNIGINDLPVEDPAYYHDNKIVNYNVLPLKAGGEIFGILWIAFSKARMLEDYEKEILLSFCDVSAITIKNSLLYEDVKKDAITDQLTGLKNRRYANMRIEEEILRVKRQEYCNIAVAMADMSNFKLINDTLGHHAGDIVLQRIGYIINENVRTTDIASRYGGDEFLLIFPGTDCHDAEKVVKKIIGKIAEFNNNHNDPALKNMPIEIALHFGICCTGCGSPEASEILSKADYALYECKTGHGEYFLNYDTLVKERPFFSGEAFALTSVFEKELANRIAYSLANLIDQKDRKTRNHSKLVSRLSVRLAKTFFFPDELIYRVKLGGLLHDIGKLGTPPDILNKSSILDDEEMSIMREHTRVGVKIISNVHNFEWLIPIIEGVHERWDGNGYPKGLKAEEIPVESRIISVVDAYLSMRIDRPYRKAISDNEAIEILLNNSGKQFDPKMVRGFLQTQRQVSGRIV